MLPLILLLLFSVSADAYTRGESLRELRKLMQQQDEQEALVNDFQTDVNLWAQSLEQFGQEFLHFVEHCRHLGSYCEQRKVQRRLRGLRHTYSQLRAQLEAVEVKYARRISNHEDFEPTLQAVEDVLKQYDETLRLVNMEIYKLVEQ
ncbi:uncharacterized protein Dwil_GK14934 [Drosophila willistoni]|uniref:Secreted protein n=1 Tax=Drosophila willistoni TaxID=7260 RepID=B4MW73_DROWI|nr:uncharacterized protein LOC6642268 [Drosophila willistoni]EDW75943.2 uncharacterized protein Dwil_GK14934 [Drosophila willistoni]